MSFVLVRWERQPRSDYFVGVAWGRDMRRDGYALGLGLGSRALTFFVGRLALRRLRQRLKPETPIGPETRLAFLAILLTGTGRFGGYHPDVVQAPSVYLSRAEQVVMMARLMGREVEETAERVRAGLYIPPDPLLEQLAPTWGRQRAYVTSDDLVQPWP